MSIKPIDIMRSQEAAQLTHMQNQRAHQIQDQFGRNFQQMVEQQNTKPTELTKTENSEYRYDAKKKGNNEYQSLGGKKKDTKKEKSKDKKDINRSSDGKIDILI